MSEILICIDDTDNLDSIGTGALLGNMCEEMHSKGLGSAGFITRHQLFIHEDIPYTSHNSSMCCKFETADVSEVLKFAKDYLKNNSAEGSDPGLCIYNFKEKDPSLLKEFGLKAKEKIVTKEEAYALAEMYPNEIYLSEHGGYGIGVIGAIAGVGLRLTGMDGRIKGKIYPETPGEKLTISEFCEKYNIANALTEDYKEIAKDEIINFTNQTKAILYQNEPACILIKENDVWIPKPKKVKDKNK